MRNLAFEQLFSGGRNMKTLAELMEDWKEYKKLENSVTAQRIATEAEISSGAYEGRLVLVITAKSRDLIGFDRIGGFKY